MDRLKALVTKIFNSFLISRFVAKNIDLFLGQLVGIVILMISLNYGIKLDVLYVSLGMAFVTVVLEAFSLYYFHVTPGKFFMGLRVYPPTLLSSFKRSFSCYFRALGLGIPVLGLGFSLGYYLLGISKKEIPWDKYGEIKQEKKHFLVGMVSALVVNVLIIGGISLVYLPSQKNVVEAPQKTTVLETIVSYPGFENLTKPAQELTEEEKSISDVWNMACRLGAVGLLDQYNGPLLEQSIALIALTCEKGIREVGPEDDIEVIYMKACGYGIGVGAALIFKDRLEDSPVHTDGERLLREICLPGME